MKILFFITAFVLAFGTFFILLRLRQRNKLGVLQHSVVYSDTQEIPGETLTSQRLPLVGKPDYVVKMGEELIPVEVKTGRTPITPYESHILQLAAYCHLVHEHFGARPRYGIVKYPFGEFHVEYTDTLESQLIKTVQEIMKYKSVQDITVLLAQESTELCKQCQANLS